MAIEADLPDINNHACCSIRVEALTMAGKVDEAFSLAKIRMIDTGWVDVALLINLSAIADRAPDPLSSEVRGIYDIYASVMDEFIDANDVLKTGYIADYKTKGRPKATKTMTLAKFKKQLVEDDKVPRINGVGETFIKAAKVFEEKDMPDQAMFCLRRALSDCSDRGRVYSEMASVMRKVGNQDIVDELEKMVDAV